MNVLYTAVATATGDGRNGHATSEDGLLDLQFTPEGARQESKNLLVAASYYIQPIGTFRGTVRAHAGAAPVAVDALLGVTEDHRSKW